MPDVCPLSENPQHTLCAIRDACMGEIAGKLAAQERINEKAEILHARFGDRLDAFDKELKSLRKDQIEVAKKSDDRDAVLKDMVTLLYELVAAVQENKNVVEAHYRDLMVAVSNTTHTASDAMVMSGTASARASAAEQNASKLHNDRSLLTRIVFSSWGIIVIISGLVFTWLNSHRDASWWAALWAALSSNP